MEKYNITYRIKNVCKYFFDICANSDDKLKIKTLLVYVQTAALAYNVLDLLDKLNPT